MVGNIYHVAKLDDALIEKYEKIVVADVVEKEILKFGKNEYFKVIAEKYKVLKKNEKIIVIEHSAIDEEDKKFLEKQLVDCDDRFQTGLEDSPHEEHNRKIRTMVLSLNLSIQRKHQDWIKPVKEQLNKSEIEGILST